MKTKAEILEKVLKHKDDFFGFWSSTLVSYLEFEEAKKVYPSSVFDLSKLTEEKWKVSPLDEASVRKELIEYLEFAWGKVEDHRGLSASLSVERCSAWAWLLGGDELVEKIEKAPYAQYEAPKLALICNELNIPKPNTSNLIRMMEGLPCSDDCESGCGR